MSQIGQYSQSLNLASGDKFITENAAASNNYYYTFGTLSGQILNAVPVSSTNIVGLISTGDADSRYLKTAGDSSPYLSTGARFYVGSGNPEGIVVAQSGSLYTDYFNTTLYQKITGSSVWGWQ